MNNSGETLAELLDAEPTATESGTVYPRWTFPDGSAVVLGQGTWRTIKPDNLTRNPTACRLRQRHTS